MHDMKHRHHTGGRTAVHCTTAVPYGVGDLNSGTFKYICCTHYFGSWRTIGGWLDAVHEWEAHPVGCALLAAVAIVGHRCW